jgi:hypothetical protein
MSTTRDLVVTDDGLSLTVTVQAEVVPGATVDIDIALRNDRSVPVAFYSACGDPRMFAMVPVPVEPAGRDWTGIAAQFKAYGLSQGLGQIDHPEATSRRVDLVGTCMESDLSLAPGGTASASISWKADLVPGVPVPSGDIPISVTVGIKPGGGAATGAPDPTEAGGGLMRIDELTVDGAIRVVGDTPKLVSAGQALDAMLADKRFTVWLAKMPRKTWSGTNVFLEDAGTGGGITAAGPSWDIELFREIGVPRNWAIGFVDPSSGKLRSLTFCTDPCDR